MASPLPAIRNTSKLVRPLLAWYNRVKRPFPWRKTRNPYRILLSEIMLQQTQVSRVLEKYPLFLKRYPDFPSLARARSGDIIRAWAGMGYNNRALHLHRSARIIVNELRGRLPASVEILLRLPGIGRYTANAVACFAFGQNNPVVDTNVRRVLSRILPNEMQKYDEWDVAAAILPARYAYNWNQALMELGSTICTASGPDCDSCPWKKICPSAFHIARPKRARARKVNRRGIPDRIIRGRVIAYLRFLDRRGSIGSEKLFTILRNSESPGKKRWPLLLRKLQRDGLIAIRSVNKKQYISLPG